MDILLKDRMLRSNEVGFENYNRCSFLSEVLKYWQMNDKMKLPKDTDMRKSLIECIIVEMIKLTGHIPDTAIAGAAKQADLIDTLLKPVFCFMIPNFTENKVFQIGLGIKVENVTIRKKNIELDRKYDYNFGDYIITFSASTTCFRINVYQEVEIIDGSIGYVKALHPHINFGSICWGDMRINVYEPLYAGNFLTAFKAMITFLNNYNEGSPFDTIAEYSKRIFMLSADHGTISHVNSSLGYSGYYLIDNVMSPMWTDVRLNFCPEGLQKDSEEGQLHLKMRNINLEDRIKGLKPSKSMKFHEYKRYKQNSIYSAFMPFVMRLVDEYNISFMRAIYISIKLIEKLNFINQMTFAKRWPGSVMKKSDFNTLRYWNRNLFRNEVYRLGQGTLFRYIYKETISKIEFYSKLISKDIDRINALRVIDGHGLILNNLNLPKHTDIFRALNNLECLDSYLQGEISCPPEELKKLKKQNCKKLRDTIKIVNMNYENAKYIEGKMKIEILNNEKEQIKHEVSSYRPSATKDKLPFESL